MKFGDIELERQSKLDSYNPIDTPIYIMYPTRYKNIK